MAGWWDRSGVRRFAASEYRANVRSNGLGLILLAGAVLR